MFEKRKKNNLSDAINYDFYFIQKKSEKLKKKKPGTFSRFVYEIGVSVSSNKRLRIQQTVDSDYWGLKSRFCVGLSVVGLR